jgi:cytochrome b561
VTEFYLILAVFFAFSLTHSSRIIRALGTLTAALALGMISWSIFLANEDGTFAKMAADGVLANRLKPLMLNTQAVIASTAALFLLWATVMQGLRRVATPLPLRNTDVIFGRVSRYAHWVIGTLILILLPMGLFTTVLAADHPERPGFMATHQTLGLTVLVLVVLRMLWLKQSPAPEIHVDVKPWQHQLAKATHIGLYVLMLGFPVTGVLWSLWRGDALTIFGISLIGLITPNETLAAGVAVVHNLLLPTVFYLAIAAHLGAVTKHHFGDRHVQAVRRMLR